MGRVLASTTFIVGMLLLDWYVFQTLRLLMQPYSSWPLLLTASMLLSCLSCCRTAMTA